MDYDEVDFDRTQYEEDLRRRQEEHMRRMQEYGRQRLPKWRPCLHDGCTECHGTGKKVDGSPCVHMISCPCPRCSPGVLCCA